MLKRDKNGFMERIKTNGFSVDDFEAYEESRDGKSAFVIHFKNSPFEFWTRNPDESYTLYDCAQIDFGPKILRSPYFPDYWTSSINDIYQLFANWLTNSVQLFIEEQSVPDLWSTLHNNSLDELCDDYSIFSPKEKLVMTEGIDQIRSFVTYNYSPSKDQLAEINRKLDYLIDAVDRLNKYDWKGTLISTLIGIATNLGLDTASGRALWDYTFNVLSNGLKMLS